MLTRQQLAELEALTRAQRRAWSYILEYARAMGRRCFSYNELARFWPSASTRINIQTLDRRIRELAEKGLLERMEYQDQRGRTRARFCIRRDLYQALTG